MSRGDTSEIYKYTADYALKNGESELFHASAAVNCKCAEAIDEAIKSSNYEQYRYKFSEAVKTVVDGFGFERVNWVLASTIHQRFFDGRFSQSNQKWAKDFSIPDERYPGFIINTHLAVLDGFIDSVRKAHKEILAEAVGSYEKSHHMADRNRLTWFHNDLGTFVPNPGVTEGRLLERYNEILEKKSVLAQIRAAKKEQKQMSDPNPKRDKKKQAPEL